MKLNEFNIILKEGGNVNIAIGGKEVTPDKVDVTKMDRDVVSKGMMDGFEKMDEAFKQATGKSCWDGNLSKNPTQYFLGSSKLFFDLNTPVDNFKDVKPTFGDFDILVSGDAIDDLYEFTKSITGKTFGDITLVGTSQAEKEATSPNKGVAHKIGRQIHAIFRYNKDPQFNFQVDFVRGRHTGSQPTVEFDKFAASADLGDIEAGIKGVFHKYLIQAIIKTASLIPKGTFKVMTTGSYKKYATEKPSSEQAIQDFINDPKKLRISNDASIEGHNISSKVFSVDLGVRTKFVPVMRFDGKQLEINGLPIYLRLDTEDPLSIIVNNLPAIFQEMFGRIPKEGEIDDIWSFVKLLKKIKNEFDKSRIDMIFKNFTKNLFGGDAEDTRIPQGIYVSPEEDYKVKSVAMNAFVKEFPEYKEQWESQEMKDRIKDYYIKYEISQKNRIETRTAKRIAAGLLPGPQAISAE